MNFKSKPPYGPIIDVVNCLAENNEVLYSHPDGTKAQGLTDNVRLSDSLMNSAAFRPQIVFSAFSSFASLAFLKASAKVPILNYRFMHATLRDVFSPRFRSLPRNYLVREISNIMMFGIPRRLWLPERFLLPNHKSRSDLENLGIARNKLEVLPWGIDVRKYDQITCKHSVDPSNATSFVYAGPLHKLRFSMDIIDAFAATSHINGDATLSLLFRGIWDSELLSMVRRRIKELQIENRVEIVTQPLTHEQLMARFVKATAVVLPYSLSGIVEMPPLTLIEAMALSKAVVTNTGLATREIIKSGYNGIIIQQDIDGYREAFGELLSNNRIATSLGRRARESVLKEFSLTGFCSRLQAIMEAIA